MPTVQQLLLSIQDKYPSLVPDSVKIKYMNEAQDQLSNDFGIIATDTSLVTRANDDEYTLPTGIEDISQIETFDVANEVPDLDKIVAETAMKVGAYVIAEQPNTPSRLSFTHESVGTADTLGTIALVGISGGVSVSETITPVANSTVYSQYFYTSITSITGASWVTDGDDDQISVGIKLARYDTTRYDIGYKDDKPMGGRCIYQNYSSLGVKTIIMYPEPELAGFPITIRYHKKLSDLSINSLTATPEFDSEFHDMLVSYACWQICANGASADYAQANRFASEYDESLVQLWKQTNMKKITAPKKRKDNRIWREGR